jgi:alpha-D-ribose 1-methylphosphonate 5-triphosphate synthase subunit PhnH
MVNLQAARQAPAAPMADDSRTITLHADDVPAFRSAIIACARPVERERCERLLGQLASLEAATPAATLQFIPARTTALLARRALEHLQRHERLSDRRTMR